MIPKIIHQIWDTEIIPDVWQNFVISWHQHNPGWRYNLWSAERREVYIEKYFPEYRPIYDQYQQTIQKADIFKYIILSAVGGVYADLDME